MIIKVCLINSFIAIISSISSYFLSFLILDICSKHFRFNYTCSFILFTSIFFSILTIILKLAFPLVEEYFNIIMISFFMSMILGYISTYYVYLYDFTSTDSNRRFAKVLSITQCSMVCAMPLLFFAL